MTNRALLGKRDSDFGLWISKSGKNVLTGNTPNNFLYMMEEQGINSVQTGSVNTGSIGGSSTNIGIVNQGFFPLVLVTFVLTIFNEGIIGNDLKFEHINNSTLRFYKPHFLISGNHARGTYLYSVLSKGAL